jgi:hypothetical protein
MKTEIVKLTDKRSIAVVSTDDVEPILEHNKLLRTLDQKSDWGRHIATIPNVILVKWLNEAWQRGQNVRYLSPEWDELVARKLQDPEWSKLRTDAPSRQVGYGDNDIR